MKKSLSIFALAMLAAAAANAKITLPRIFSDYMVLQAQAPVNIWGEAEPNAQVEAVIADKKQSAKAGADGKFAPYSKVGHSDDAYSWSPNQVDR